VNVWLFTQDAAGGAASKKSSAPPPSKGAYGATLMITSQTEIDPGSTQMFTGRISFKKIKIKGGIEDAV